MSSLDPDTPLKICIRGLPVNTDPRGITKELRERGFTPTDVQRVPPRLDKPGCIFFAQLQNTPGTVPAVYQIKKLLEHSGVAVEAWRGKKGPTQCSRCLGFWHLETSCHREHRCLRCAGPHPLKLCIRPRDKPTCANCGGPHVANNTSCPVYRREQRNMMPKPLRIIGYEITTPNVVEEASAPNSLMADANEKFEEPKQTKKRGRRNRGKNGNSDTSSIISESQQQFLQPEQDELKPALIAPVIKEKVEFIGMKLNTDAVHAKVNGISEQELQKLKLPQAITIPTKEKEAVPNSDMNKEAVSVKVASNSVPQKPDQELIQPQLQIQKPQQAAAVSTKENMIGFNSNTNKEAVPIKITSGSVPQKLDQKQLPTMTVPVHTKEEKYPTDTMTTSPDSTKVISDCLSILQGVLSAIQVGQSPIPIILQGIVDLKVHLQLSNKYPSGYS